MKCEWIVTAWENSAVHKTHALISAQMDEGQEKNSVNLYPEITYQIFEGFGGSITEAAAYTYSQMPKSIKAEFLDACFGNDGLGYTQARMALDSCDAALGNYSAMDNAKDLSLGSFSLSRDEQYILPFYNAVSDIVREEITVMLSPWSPPPFMKTNGEKNNGGRLKPEYRSLWAEYFCKYIEEYKSRGVNIRRISIQNEPAATQIWDSCCYTAKEEKEFLRDFLYPALMTHGLTDDLEIYIWDHNKERVLERAFEIIDDSTEHIIAGIAFHWYSGDHFESLQMLRERFPNLKLAFTEGCVEYSRFASDSLANARMYGHDIAGDLNGGANMFIAWSVLFNKEGGPNHVQNLCEAPIMYDTKTQKMDIKLSYEYIGHYSKYIIPGSVRIGMSRYTDKVDVTAFKRPDNSIAAVLMNRTAEKQDVYLRKNGEVLHLKLPGDAIGTAVIG